MSTQFTKPHYITCKLPSITVLEFGSLELSRLAIHPSVSQIPMGRSCCCFMAACAAVLLVSLLPYTSALANPVDQNVAIVNGRAVTANSYPALTALLTGRGATVRLNDQVSVNGYFFGHGLKNTFSGDITNCGVASTVCSGAFGRICLIATDSQTAKRQSPSVQLANCSAGGGVGALFFSADGVMPRTDMFDGLPQIPAVFVSGPSSQTLRTLIVKRRLARVDVHARVLDSILCGATHLGNQWVLTAAHCVLEQTPDGQRVIQPWEITASIGAHNLYQDKHLSRSVEAIFIPAENVARTAPHQDIALLKLARAPINGGDQSTDPEQSAAMKIASGEVVADLAMQAANVLVLGWGSTTVREPTEGVDSGIATSSTPRSAVVNLVPINQCRARWQEFLRASNIASGAVQIDHTVLCAHEPSAQRDTCQGDSGGPLLVDVDGELELAGITSFGLGCGSRNSVPAVYTRVSEYMAWMNITMGNQAATVVTPAVTVNSLAASGVVGTGGIQTGMLLQLLCFVALIALHGCRSTSPVISTADSTATPAESMDIISTAEQLQLTVTSHGCTSPDHFEVIALSRCVYVIDRIRPDLCKRAGFTTTISLARVNTREDEECLDAEVVFTNPPLSTLR